MPDLLTVAVLAAVAAAHVRESTTPTGATGPVQVYSPDQRWTAEPGGISFSVPFDLFVLHGSAAVHVPLFGYCVVRAES